MFETKANWSTILVDDCEAVALLFCDDENNLIVMVQGDDEVENEVLRIPLEPLSEVLPKEDDEATDTEDDAQSAYPPVA